MAVKNYLINDKWLDIDKQNIVEVKSTDGVIGSIKLNGEEYGGGGGESDFQKVNVFTIDASHPDAPTVVINMKYTDLLSSDKTIYFMLDDSQATNVSGDANTPYVIVGKGEEEGSYFATALGTGSTDLKHHQAVSINANDRIAFLFGDDPK